MSDPQQIAEAVARRAAEIPHAPAAPVMTDPRFVLDCLAANERGDGLLFAHLHAGRFLYNVTPKDGEWLSWTGVVWEVDTTLRVRAAVEDVALQYDMQVQLLGDEIKQKSITEKHPESYKIRQRKKLKSRANRLRSSNGVSKCLQWAPIVDPRMICRESDFDKHPWLLPCRNGVINLRTGILESGRPEDRLTRRIDLDYDPHAPYPQWTQFVREISNSDDLADFIRRSFGYAITGHSWEQFIWCFVGKGRNGKGVLLGTISSILGPYYHKVSRGMLIEQRNEQSPSAASEHKYALLSKRLIVAFETNEGQRIDSGAIKELTGEDDISCRPLFKSEIVFSPSHTLMLQTNHVPVGLTRDFALVQRILKIDFPYSYVDDVAAEEKRYPMRKGMFKPKDNQLKEKLRAERQGILAWLVRGCLEWQQIGLAPPDSVLASVDELAREEDWFGQFLEECLDVTEKVYETPAADLYTVFKWWWEENRDARENRIPSPKKLGDKFSENGYEKNKASSKKSRKGIQIKYGLLQEAGDYFKNKR